MAKKLIALSDGHGMSTSGKRTPILPNGEKSETGNFMHENEFNRAVVKYLKEELKRNGFDTIEVAPTDADTPLGTRTSLANAKGADLYVSVHANANTGKWGNWGGIETFVYPNGESKRIGQIIHKHLMRGSKLTDRGVKDGSHLWEIRKTAMPSVLVEAGFMDSHNDYKFLLSDAYRRECAKEIAMAICEAFGVKYKEATESKPVANPTPAKPSAKSHTVEKGETYYSIAKKHGMDVNILMGYNPRVKPENLKVGDVIHLIPVPSSAIEKPTPKPVQKKKYLVLPKTASSWNVYPLSKAPVKANACGSLNPKKFGGLTYEILGNPQKDVYIIQTGNFGKVQIYAHPSTGATIVEK